MNLHSECDVTNPSKQQEYLYGHRTGGIHGALAEPSLTRTSSSLRLAAAWRMCCWIPLAAFCTLQ